MDNSFDKKIKDSLENFEMPYDANAWAALDKKLPQTGAAPAATSSWAWKLGAFIAVVGTIATTAWYTNSINQNQSTELPKVEPTEFVNSSPQISSTELASESQAVEGKQANASETNQPKQNQQTEAAPAKEHSQPQPVASALPTTTQPEEPETKALANEQPPAPENLSINTPSAPKDARLNVQFSASALEVCVGQTVSFTNQTNLLDANMKWNFGDGTASDDLHPVHAFMVPGLYTVLLQATHDEKSAEQLTQVRVNPSPTVILEAVQKLDGYDAIPFYAFETILQPNHKATWAFSDGGVYQGASTDYLFRNAGTSTVTLTVENNFGCRNTEQWRVENRENFDLLAPTGFTPDGNLNNETFIPKALPLMNVPFEMVILNQKGQEVYRTANASEPWNGRLHNRGTKLDAGVYVWTVVLKSEIAFKKTFSGTITLQR